MKKKDIFWFLGLQMLPIGLAIDLALAPLLRAYRSALEGGQFSPTAGTLREFDYRLLWIIGLAPWIIIFLRNLYKLASGTVDFNPFSHEKTLDRSRQKIEAMYQPPLKKYLSKKPEGIVYGKWRNRYVRRNIDPSNIQNEICSAPPGAGKTTMYLDSLIYNFNFVEEKDRMTVFCHDVKPEISYSCVYEGRPDVKIVNPASFTGYGFDVLYGIDKDSTDDELIQRADLIARSLIVESRESNGDNHIFYASAQNVLVGFLCYGMMTGRGFIGTMMDVIHIPSEDLLTTIVSDTEEMKKHPKIAGMLKEYEGKTTDAMQDIQLTLKQDLRIFDTDTVKWQLGDNPKKASPEDLVNGISIFLALPDHLIQQYACIFRMIDEFVMYFLSSMEEKERRKKDARIIWLFLDEFGSIAKLPSITDRLARLRSRKVMITLVVQGLSQLDEYYSPNGRRTILQTCRVKTVLGSEEPEDAEVWSRYFNTFNEEKISRQRGSGSALTDSTPENVTIEEKQIMTSADILEMDRSEMLLMIDGRKMLIKKCPFYQVELLERKFEEIQNQNEKYEAEQLQKALQIKAEYAVRKKKTDTGKYSFVLDEQSLKDIAEIDAKDKKIEPECPDKDGQKMN